MREYLTKFLLSNNEKTINPNILSGIISFLKNFCIFHEQHNKTRFWIASSIVFMVDNTAKNFKCAWLDFNYVGNLPAGKECDTNILEGAQVLLKLFSEIQEKGVN
jgi:hypothetical protein